MEAPHQQRPLSEGSGNDHVNLTGTKLHKRGTPKSSGSSTCSTCFRCVDSKSTGNPGQKNGDNNSTSTGGSVTNASWADQIQDAHNNAWRLELLQALAYASGEHDDASDKKPNQTETYLDAMTLPSFQPLAIGHPALTANRSQPAASPTHSEVQSNGQASTNEEAQRARSMNIYACILVVIGYTVVIWKEPSATERIRNILTLDRHPEIEPGASEPTRFAAWGREFQDMVDGPWI